MQDTIDHLLFFSQLFTGQPLAHTPTAHHPPMQGGKENAFNDRKLEREFKPNGDRLTALPLVHSLGPPPPLRQLAVPLVPLSASSSLLVATVLCGGVMVWDG